LQAFAASGAPLNRLGYFDATQSTVIYLVPRGSAGRLPTQWDANLSVAYPLTVGPATVTLQAYVFDLFNNQTPLTRNDDWTTSPNGQPFDPNQPSNNDGQYGKFTSRTTPRSFRAAVRVSF
jgi:hypothetical protein